MYGSSSVLAPGRALLAGCASMFCAPNHSRYQPPISRSQNPCTTRTPERKVSPIEAIENPMIIPLKYSDMLIMQIIRQPACGADVIYSVYNSSSSPDTTTDHPIPHIFSYQCRFSHPIVCEGRMLNSDIEQVYLTLLRFRNHSAGIFLQGGMCRVR